MIILSIDPAVAKKDAYGVWQNGRLVACGKFADDNNYRSVLRSMKVSLVSVEDQYLHRSLSHRAGEIAGMAMALEIKTEYVNPAVWMSAVGVKKHDEIVDRAIEYAGKYGLNLDGIEMDDDIGAAILIGVPAAKEYFGIE